MKDPFKKMLSNVRQSARSANQKGQKHGRALALDVDIDAEYLKEVYEQYNGYCPYYLSIGVYKKIDLDLVFESHNMLAPSVDRIDSTKGYIRGNIVITHRITNLGKQSIPFDDFINQLRTYAN